jgi:hypothetical protein
MTKKQQLPLQDNSQARNASVGGMVSANFRSAAANFSIQSCKPRLEGAPPA